MRRKLVLTIGGLVAVAAAFAAPALADDAPMDPQRKMIRDEIQAYMKDQKTDFRVFWKDGLNFETPDKKFKLAIGGRTQLTSWYFNDDDIQSAINALDDPGTMAREPWDGVWHSGYEFRRVRLKVKGTLWEHTAFCTQLDFAGAKVVFKDVYLQFVDLDKCWGCMFPTITIGHCYEQFSLESLTSDLNTTFIERALPVDCFQPERHTGFYLNKSFYGDRVTAAAGFYGHTAAASGDGFWYGDGTDGGYDVTGRVTVLPWAPCSCDARFLEVGVSASYQSDYQQLQYGAHPEAHIGSKIADTGKFSADHVILLGGEMAFGYDRFHLQGEWIGAFVTSAAVNDPTLSGWYVEASYMLNGPNRPFSKGSATFGAVKPCKYFLEDCCGWGAFEVAARYSTLDLTDEGLFGGEVKDITVGLNWYLNKNTKIAFNYVVSKVDRLGIDEHMNEFGVMFQIWF